jgi:plasmid stabilization system protein ParE
MSRRAVRITRNFAGNLDDIERFLQEQDAPRAFSALLKQLFETIVPNLRRFPNLGKDFLARQPRSTEGAARLVALKERLGENSQLREYVTGDYIILYATRGNTLYLLSIRHHRQLSFDFRGHW